MVSQNFTRIKSYFFNILKNGKNIGYYGIEKVDGTTAEISVYFKEQDRYQINKGIAVLCLRFPFALGFSKILISTELKKMARFLKKMSRFGVKYLTNYNNLEWFEVLK